MSLRGRKTTKGSAIHRFKCLDNEVFVQKLTKTKNKRTTVVSIGIGQSFPGHFMSVTNFHLKNMIDQGEENQKRTCDKIHNSPGFERTAVRNQD